MKAETEETWKVLYRWLIQMGNAVDLQYTKEEVSSHPEYPSLISVIDFLDSGGLEYKAVNAGFIYINEFNYPLLAVIKEQGNNYLYLVTKIDDWKNKHEILQNWSGVVVFAETGSKWQSAANDVFKKRKTLNNIFLSVAFGIGLIFFLSGSVTSFNTILTIFGLLSLCGLMISILSLATELGYQSEIVKQVCGSINEGGCIKVLKSKYANGLVGITPADMSLVYFSTQFLLLIAAIFFPALTHGVLFFSFGGIAAIFWSVYTQWAILQEWCMLCITVSVVLLIQFIIAISVLPGLPRSSTLLYFVLAFAILMLILKPIKGLIKTNKINSSKLIELRRWKQDAAIFISQWMPQAAVDVDTWQNDLIIGNPDAVLQLTVACNPYCGPCATAHKEIETLMQRSKGKIKIQFRFLCFKDNPDHKLTIAVKNIFQKAQMVKNNIEVEKMLSDWFEYMDLEKWRAIWPTDNSIDVNYQFEKNNYWVDQSKIAYTPTFFLNGKQLPGRYSLKDLQLLLPDLSELLTDG